MFSDEFNKAGRTFKAGDDPYWEAVDLWYGVTQVRARISCVAYPPLTATGGLGVV